MARTCIQSLTDLLTGMEADAMPVHYLSYERFRQWKNCLSLFLKAGIIRQSGRVVHTAPCAECGSNVKVEKEFCQCPHCGLARVLSEEEISLYETTLDAIADFVQANMDFERNRQSVEVGRLIYLGRHTFHNGEYAVFVARGLTREDTASAIYAGHCRPPNRSTHVLILSTCCEELSTGNSRIVQVPIIDLLGIDGDALVFRDDRIQLKLRGVYGDAGVQAKVEGEERFIAHFMNAKSAIRRGEKEKWEEIAEIEFGVGARRFREIWQKYAPDSLKKAGAPSKKSRPAA